MTQFFNTINWHPGIGDPTFMGWFTVLVYLVAGFLALRVYTLGNYAFGRMHRKQKRLWLAIAIVLLLLCINKQLDLQSLLTAIARYQFRQWGIYESRGEYQQLFIQVMLVAGVIVMAGLLLEYYKVWRNHWLALSGLVLLMVFILIRAASFHHMDRLIHTDIFGVRLNWVFELSGLALIIVNGLILVKKGFRRRKKVHSL